VFGQLANGAGKAEELGVGGQPSGVTPDGTQVLLSRSEPSDIMALTLDGTRRVHTLLQTPAVERNGVISPDGHWLAYESDSAGRCEIYVRPFPDITLGPRLVSTDGGTRPLWAPPTAQDRELFYVARDGTLMGVRVDSRGDVWSAGNPTKVVEGLYATAGSRFPRTYDVSADGQRFLMVKQPANQAAPQIVVVQNWIEELKRLVPTS
jgi:eukaryotic-like serine/threonine-protein kinase